MDSMVVQPGPAGKDEVRRLVTRALAQMSADQRAREGQTLVERLDTGSSAFKVVLATLPLADEVDLTPFLSRCLATGRRVALARTGPGRTLSFHYISTLDGPWEARPLGLKEPPAQAPRWEPGPPTLCLVPGLAFAAGTDGWWRLGRGAGYYDRWLAEYGWAVTSWGVGFSVQRVASVPVEAHDQRLNGMVLPGPISASPAGSKRRR